MISGWTVTGSYYPNSKCIEMLTDNEFVIIYSDWDEFRDCHSEIIEQLMMEELGYGFIME